MKTRIIKLFIAFLAALLLLPSNLIAQDDFQKGVQAYKDKDYKTALQYFLRYNDTSSKVNSALCYYFLEDYDNAIKMALNADVNDPTMLGVIADSWWHKSDLSESSTAKNNAAIW